MKRIMSRKIAIILGSIVVVVLAIYLGLALRTHLVIQDMKQEVTEVANLIGIEPEEFTRRGNPECLDACLSVGTLSDNYSESLENIANILNENNINNEIQSGTKDTIDFDRGVCDFGIVLNDNKSLFINCIHERFIGA